MFLVDTAHQPTEVGEVCRALLCNLDLLRRMCFAYTAHGKSAEDSNLVLAHRVISVANAFQSRHRKALRILDVRPHTALQHRVTVSWLGDKMTSVTLNLYPPSKRKPTDDNAEGSSNVD